MFKKGDKFKLDKKYYKKPAYIIGDNKKYFGLNLKIKLNINIL